MLEAFIEQDYLIIESNVVTNICIWNGDTSQWTPPTGSIALVKSLTPAMDWVLITTEIEPPTTPPTYTSSYVLQENIGGGQIGFTWDGTKLTTNLPAPQINKKAPNQPNQNGLQQA